MRKSVSIYLTLLPVLVVLLASCGTTRRFPDSRYPDNSDRDRRVIIVDRDDDHHHKGRGRGHYEHGRGNGYGHHKHGDNRGVVAVRIRRPLIIIRTPDIIIGRYTDGRYYYRNPDGFMYWEGRDNRFYLDEQYLGRVEYNDNEYTEWSRRGDRNYSNNYDRRDNNNNNNNNGYRNDNRGNGNNQGNGNSNGRKKGHGRGPHG